MVVLLLLFTTVRKARFFPFKTSFESQRFVNQGSPISCRSMTFMFLVEKAVYVSVSFAGFSKTQSAWVFGTTLTLSVVLTKTKDSSTPNLCKNHGRRLLFTWVRLRFVKMPYLDRPFEPPKRRVSRGKASTCCFGACDFDEALRVAAKFWFRLRPMNHFYHKQQKIFIYSFL